VRLLNNPGPLIAGVVSQLALKLKARGKPIFNICRLIVGAFFVRASKWLRQERFITPKKSN
jgi:hypothetical protein